MFIQTRPQLALQKSEPAGHILAYIGDFGNVFNGLAKNPRGLRSIVLNIE